MSLSLTQVLTGPVVAAQESPEKSVRLTNA